MDHPFAGEEFMPTSIKYLLQGLPEDATDTQLRSSIRQKKYMTLWVLPRFLDATSALVAVRVPRKSKIGDFTLNVRRREVKAVKLTEGEEDEYELLLNTTTMDMFSSAKNLREIVEPIISTMKEVEKKDLFQGRKGDIKHDLILSTSDNYEVYPFGSRVMGLGQKESDYDIFVDMGNYYRGGGETKMENSIQLLGDLLRHSKSFAVIVMIPRARVPVLKVRHKATNIHCDISTTNGLGVENTKLLRMYLADKRVRFVCTAVKLWLHQLGLSQAAMGSGTFTSYCLLWMVLYALMQDSPPAVPSVISIRKEYTGPRLFVDGWDCSFCNISTLPKTENKKSEIELLYQFFNFYSSFTLANIKENVICPYMGTMIPVGQFEKVHSLPGEFDNYKKQVVVDKFYQLNSRSFMCVQDPIEQGHNIAKTVEDWVLDRFFKLCKTTSDVMEHNMTPELKHMSTNSNGT